LPGFYPMPRVTTVALLVRGLPLAQNRLPYRVGVRAAAGRTDLNSVFTRWRV
jgi:hypothetical protein